MISKTTTCMRYGVLVLAVCLLCSPAALAAPGLSGPGFTTAAMSIPDISDSLFPAPDSAINPDGNITSIYYFIRRDDLRVTKNMLPLTGGTINITNSEILVFRISAKYTGPAGTTGMLDLVNSGTYPLNKTQRVDAAVLIPSGSSGTLTSPPYWFGMSNRNNGTYGFGVELFGNKSFVKFTSITVKVRSS